MAKLIELLVVFSIYAFLSLCGGLIFSHIGLELIKNLKAHNTNFDPFLVEHNPQYTRVDIEIAKHCKKEREKDNPRLDFLVRYCKHTIRVPAEVPSQTCSDMTLQQCSSANGCYILKAYKYVPHISDSANRCTSETNIVIVRDGKCMARVRDNANDTCVPCSQHNPESTCTQ